MHGPCSPYAEPHHFVCGIRIFRKRYCGPRGKSNRERAKREAVETFPAHWSKMRGKEGKEHRRAVQKKEKKIEKQDEGSSRQFKGHQKSKSLLVPWEFKSRTLRGRAASRVSPIAEMRVTWGKGGSIEESNSREG